jgi:hypothetical protein
MNEKGVCNRYLVRVTPVHSIIRDTLGQPGIIHSITKEVFSFEEVGVCMRQFTTMLNFSAFSMARFELKSIR